MAAPTSNCPYCNSNQWFFEPAVVRYKCTYCGSGGPAADSEAEAGAKVDDRNLLGTGKPAQ